MSVLVDARDVTVGFGRSRVLEGVDLTVHCGQQLALVGRSGSGKSTLLLALAGLLAVDHGSVAWPGMAADPAVRRSQLAMVFQAPSLVAELTAAQNVALPLRLRGQDRATAYRAAQSALAELGLDGAGGALPDELSGGQQQGVALARALAGRPLLVLADEPTGALDRATAEQALAVLRGQVTAVGGALLVATHDAELAATLPDRRELRDGHLTSQATSAAAPGSSTWTCG